MRNKFIVFEGIDSAMPHLSISRRCSRASLLRSRKEWRVIPCLENGTMRSTEEIHELVWKAVQ